MSPERWNLNNIFLVGFMGAGKTTVGRILAAKLGYRYCDSDKVIETKAGKSVSDIFSALGESHFRELESETLESLSGKIKQVIATGGGAVMRDRNWDAMKKGGVTIYLSAPFDALWDRVKHSKIRPLLNVDNPIEASRELLLKRAPFYERADLTIDTEGLSVEEIASRITKKLRV
jgi:shikimate kinase